MPKHIEIIAKGQDIDDPSLSVEKFMTSMTLLINFAYFRTAQHEQKIIRGENEPLKTLVGAQDDFLRFNAKALSVNGNQMHR